MQAGRIDDTGQPDQQKNASKHPRSWEDLLKALVALLMWTLRSLVMIGVIDGGAAFAAQGSASSAENVYAAAPPRLLQIRTLVADTGRQASIGSGFLGIRRRACHYELSRSVAVRARTPDLSA